MGNTVFCDIEKLLERWYLLIAETFYFEVFGIEKTGFFVIHGIMTFTD